MNWEDAALRLLEMNLNGESLDANGLKDLFAGAPDILDGALGKIVHTSHANATIKFDDPSCGQWAVQWPFIWAEASTPY